MLLLSAVCRTKRTKLLFTPVPPHREHGRRSDSRQIRAPGATRKRRPFPSAGASPQGRPSSPRLQPFGRQAGKPRFIPRILRVLRQKRISRQTKPSVVPGTGLPPHLAEEDLFLGRIHRHDVDFVFVPPIPPGTDLGVLSALAKSVLPRIAKRRAVESVGKHGDGLLQEPLLIAFFEKRPVEVDASEPEDKEGIRQLESVTPIVRDAAQRFLASNEPEMVFELVELALDVSLLEGRKQVASPRHARRDSRERLEVDRAVVAEFLAQDPFTLAHEKAVGLQGKAQHGGRIGRARLEHRLHVVRHTARQKEERQPILGKAVGTPRLKNTLHRCRAKARELASLGRIKEALCVGIRKETSQRRAVGAGEDQERLRLLPKFLPILPPSGKEVGLERPEVLTLVDEEHRRP